jgi:hypothetical protein
MRRLAFLLYAALLGGADPTMAQSYGANDAAFLNLVGDLEGPGGFNTVYNGAPIAPPKPIDTMTIAEILAYQEDLRAAGTQSSAVARYQIIYDTLSEAVDTLDLHTGLVFDSEIQTYMARHFMDRCGFYDPETPIPALGDCLARVWAALPLFTGPYAGRSAYEGIGDNKALTSVGRVQTVLENRFRW